MVGTEQSHPLQNQKTTSNFTLFFGLTWTTWTCPSTFHLLGHDEGHTFFFSEEHPWIQFCSLSAGNRDVWGCCFSPKKFGRLFVGLFIKYLRSPHFSHLPREKISWPKKSWKSQKLENEDASCVYLKFKKTTGKGKQRVPWGPSLWLYWSTLFTTKKKSPHLIDKVFDVANTTWAMRCTMLYVKHLKLSTWLCGRHGHIIFTSCDMNTQPQEQFPVSAAFFWHQRADPVFFVGMSPELDCFFVSQRVNWRSSSWQARYFSYHWMCTIKIVNDFESSNW